MCWKASILTFACLKTDFGVSVLGHQLPEGPEMGRGPGHATDLAMSEASATSRSASDKMLGMKRMN